MTITPGPWKLKFEPVGNPVDHADFPHAHFLAGEDDYWDDATNTGFHLSGIMNEDDAHLMAAAPDTYTSAREIDRLYLVIESAVRNADPRNHALVVAALKANQAAIAKAEGRS